MADDDARIRGNLSATVGSLLEATDAPALEHGIGEAYFENVELDAGTLRAFREALAPGDVAARFYPVPLNSQERLSEYSGSTKLGRMTHAYPAPFIRTAQEVVGRDSMTAQEMLQVLFDRWEAEFSWFTAKPVPDLRYRVAEPGTWSGDTGLLTVEAIWMPQDPDLGGRLSMRAITDEILAVFPGTALVQDADGDIAIRPTYGPDAPTTALRLTYADMVSMSRGRPDPRGVKNRARVETSARRFERNTPLTQLAWSVVAHFDEDVITRPEGSQLLPPPRLLGYSDEVLVDLDAAVTIHYTHTIYAANNTSGDGLYVEKTEQGEVEIPAGVGQSVRLTFSDPVGGVGSGDSAAEISWDLTRGEEGIGVNTPTYGIPDWSDGLGTHIWFAYALSWEVEGTAFTEPRTRVTGTFGYDLAGEELPDNALAASQERHGEREMRIHTSIFALEEDQAIEIAEGLVLHHITPRTIRQVEQSWWRAFPVTTDHVGRLVELPNGEVGYVQQREYRDDFSDPLRPVVASSFEFVLTEDFTGDASNHLTLDLGASVGPFYNAAW